MAEHGREHAADPQKAGVGGSTPRGQSARSTPGSSPWPGTGTRPRRSSSGAGSEPFVGSASGSVTTGSAARWHARVSPFAGPGDPLVATSKPNDPLVELRLTGCGESSFGIGLVVSCEWILAIYLAFLIRTILPRHIIKAKASLQHQLVLLLEASSIHLSFRTGE